VQKPGLCFRLHYNIADSLCSFKLGKKRTTDNQFGLHLNVNVNKKKRPLSTLNCDTYLIIQTSQ